jgi:hypothetical protein
MGCRVFREKQTARIAAGRSSGYPVEPFRVGSVEFSL